MQDMIEINEKLKKIITQSDNWSKAYILAHLVQVIENIDSQIKAYDTYMNQLALEQEKIEDRVAAAA